ncbi:hypothetical protein FOCG_08322 [Fusarium oxysporum f. sp. radicis-lycopersici 26381]|uniref:Uncharacterized protein n=1 Tax=Fusarium oxysporum Fo47 TaxID=660027 RepID=W9JNI3_FUSOX|nr:hypothetical protein FOZG_15614 [Fusarium oxysporum Fo47]EWZ79805.1 hypothetical protein FOWG_16133 [Fusarium oxysporum f. sp. lycopersici MN25]EXL52530.1 hypothetical protein FOCG_08322 [Fusarium oxysporum f. sp. radicis-lycopersici 26381]
MLELEPVDVCWRTRYVVIDYRDRMTVTGLTVVDDDYAAAHLVMEVGVPGLF